MKEKKFPECILSSEELEKMDKEEMKKGRYRVGFEDGLPIYLAVGGD